MSGCVCGLRVTGLLEGRCEPLKTFVQTITGGSAGRLDELESRFSVCSKRER